MLNFLKEAATGAAIIAASGAIYWDSLTLKASTYDPLGSGAMPRMVAGAIIVLTAAVLLQHLAAALFAPRRVRRVEALDYPQRPWLGAAIFAYMTAATVMVHYLAPFGITGTLFLFASIMTIKRFQLSAILPAALCSAAVGYGLTYLFGRVFGVDLP